MQPLSPRPNGRPSFRPTEKDRKLAHLLASCGIPQDEIAESMSGSSQTGGPETMSEALKPEARKTVGISPKTLRKHLRRELTLGGIEANLSVLNALHKMARSGRRKHIAAAIFWAKSRCGFQPIYSPSNQLYIYRREIPRSLDLQKNQVKEHLLEAYV